MLETVRCPPDRQLVLFHFFLKIVRIIAILTPKSLRKDTVQTSEQHLMSVFFSRSAIWSESFSLLRNHLKCRFCQKIASHLRRMSGAALGHGDTICDDGRVWKAIIEALLLCPKHLLLSALQKRLRNQGIQNNLSCETFQMSHYNCYSSSEGWILMAQKEQRGEVLLNINTEKTEAHPSSWSGSYFSSQRCIERSKFRHEITLKFPYTKRLKWP